MELKYVKKIKLPDCPGVYIFKKGREILYIGKATSLKDRVRSYFSNDLIKTRGPRIIDMVTQSAKLDFIETDSVLEALILESNLIKKHKPKYNILEKDNKSYNYVVISNEDFPLVSTERGRNLEFEKELKKKYKYVFGPYPHGGQLREALKIIRHIFPFRTGTQLSTLYREIGLEPNGSDKKAQKLYGKNINHIRLFFQGKKKELEKSLEKEMMQHAKAKEFELAEKIKSKLFAIKHIKDVSLLKNEKTQNANGSENEMRIEAFDVAHQSGQNTVGVMVVVNDSEAQKSEYRKFIIRSKTNGDDLVALEELLTRRFKHSEWNYPDLIVIDGGITQRNRAIKTLKGLGVTKIPLVNVVKDERHKPKKFIGTEILCKKYKNEILLANSEAHRFAISFFRKKQRKGLIK